MSTLKDYTSQQLEFLQWMIGNLFSAMGSPPLHLAIEQETRESAIIKLARDRIDPECRRLEWTGPSVPDYKGDRLRVEDFCKPGPGGHYFGATEPARGLRKLAQLAEDVQIYPQEIVLEERASVTDFNYSTLHFTYYQRHEGELVPQRASAEADPQVQKR